MWLPSLCLLIFGLIGFCLLDIPGAILGVCCGKSVIHQWQLHYYQKNFWHRSVPFLKEQMMHSQNELMQTGNYHFFNDDFPHFFYQKVFSLSYHARFLLLELICSQDETWSDRTMILAQWLHIHETDSQILKIMYQDSNLSLASILGFSVPPSPEQIRNRFLFWSTHYVALLQKPIPAFVTEYILMRKQAVTKAYTLLTASIRA